MTFSLKRLLAIASLISLASVPSVALGQTTPDAWPGLTPSHLQTVYVLDHSSKETSGTMLRLNPDSLVLLVNGTERRFDMATVARIQKRDSLKNGTWIGAVVGAAMGLVTAGISDCPGGTPGGRCGGFRAATFAASVGIYAGLGAGTDALIRGRTTIYAAPTSSSSRPAVRGAPQVGFSW